MEGPSATSASSKAKPDPADADPPAGTPPPPRPLPLLRLQPPRHPRPLPRVRGGRDDDAVFGPVHRSGADLAERNLANARALMIADRLLTPFFPPPPPPEPRPLPRLRLRPPRHARPLPRVRGGGGDAAVFVAVHDFAPNILTFHACFSERIRVLCVNEMGEGLEQTPHASPDKATEIEVLNALIAALARVDDATSGSTRLVDSIFKSTAEFNELAGGLGQAVDVAPRPARERGDAKARKLRTRRPARSRKNTSTKET